MHFPSAKEFTSILLAKPLESIVEKYLFQGTPFVFRNHPKAQEVLCQHLSSTLNFSNQNVIVVGSAKIGFSLSPNNFPRTFSDESDIDILIVDATLFDQVWMTMLRWNYPRRYHLSGVDWAWAKSRKDDLYWGWFTPNKIRFEGLSVPHVLKPLRDLSTSWFNAFRSLSQYSQYPEFARRDVSGRLYRTWDHALLYHIEGLRKIRNAVQAKRKGVSDHEL